MVDQYPENLKSYNSITKRPTTYFTWKRKKKIIIGTAQCYKYKWPETIWNSIQSTSLVMTSLKEKHVWGPWIRYPQYKDQENMLPHQFRDNAPCQLGSSYRMRTTPLFPRQHNSPKRKGGNERVTGRKARGLQMEEIACMCQTFLSLLSGRRKQTNNIFFLLYTNLKRGFS